MMTSVLMGFFDVLVGFFDENVLAIRGKIELSNLVGEDNSS